LRYLFGDEVFEALDDYDLGEESDLMALVERFLPAPSDPPLRAIGSAVRTIVVNQILNDDPPAAWQAVERMRSAGLDRDRVLSQLSMVVYQNVVEATITIAVVDDEPAVTDALAAAVRAAYDDEQHEHGLPVSADDLTVWLCHHHPEFFSTPLPPLSDWLAAAGLELNGSLVAHDATVWRRDLLRRRHYMLIDLVPQRWSRRVRQLLTPPVASNWNGCSPNSTAATSASANSTSTATAWSVGRSPTTPPPCAANSV
jgi:hypothetical protein